MATVLETPPRPARDRPETDLLFTWLEDALDDPVVDTHEFLAAVGRLAEVLEQTTSSPPSLAAQPSPPPALRRVDADLFFQP